MHRKEAALMFPMLVGKTVQIDTMGIGRGNAYWLEMYVERADEWWLYGQITYGSGKQFKNNSVHYRSIKKIKIVLSDGNKRE
jgi:hypothetical protein